MGLMICGRCESNFKEEENFEYDKDTGFTWITCPCCGEDADLYEAEQCRRCGEVRKVEEMYEGLCKECAEDMLTKENIIDYLSDYRNFEDFVNDAFAPSTVVEILYDALKEDCTEYCEENLDNFVWFISSHKKTIKSV